MNDEEKISYRLRQAIQGVIVWNESVINSLPPLEWKTSSNNKSKAYTRINPNSLIKRITENFTSETRNHLKVLSGTVEKETLGEENEDARQLQQAMQGLLFWTDRVVNGLNSLKWIEYGEMNYGIPMYAQVNPNEFIKDIIATYTSETMDHIRVLTSMVDILSMIEERSALGLAKHEITSSPIHPINQSKQDEDIEENPKGVGMTTENNDHSCPSQVNVDASVTRDHLELLSPSMTQKLNKDKNNSNSIEVVYHFKDDPEQGKESKEETTKAQERNNLPNMKVKSKMTRSSKLIICTITLTCVAFSLGWFMNTIYSSSQCFSKGQVIKSITPENMQIHQKTNHTILITGATGRTGSLFYSFLSSNFPTFTIRALVRDVDKARSVLKCTVCDESEGIYIGDVTNPADLIRAARGVDTLVILASSGYPSSKQERRAVEFDGVVSSVAALGQLENRNREGGLEDLRVVMCSSMGTTSPGSGPDDAFSNILFWKLNAEAFLGSSGIESTIVKPCGLIDAPGGNSTLVVGHKDTLLQSEFRSVTREDVARVMLQAVVRRTKKLRFDLCSKPGKGTKNIDKLLEEARWEWERVE